MAKNKAFILNRKQYDHIRKMDHCQMTLWAESVYKSGFKDGKDSADGLTEEEVKKIILSVKGIGEKKANDIMQAIISAGKKEGGGTYEAR
jgi:hypothetical protein